MKKIALITAIVMAAVLCMTGCGVNDPLSNSDVYTATKAEETTVEASSGEAAEVKAEDYDNTVEGLCKYLLDLKYLSGDSTKMAADLIGAQAGYRYSFTYEKGTIMAELYGYDTNNLNDTAKKMIESVKKNGYFQIEGFDKVSASMSDNGKYLIVYLDSNLINNDNPNEANKQREEDFLSAAKGFYK